VITHIEIENFKSLQKVSLALGPLNIFVGTNASGKSNFLEALRILQGIGYGYTVDEIFNGKPKGATSEVWEGIRGGTKYSGFLGSSRDIQFSVLASAAGGSGRYSVSISPQSGSVTDESFVFGDDEIRLLPGYLTKDRSRPGFAAMPVDPHIGTVFQSFRLHLGDLQWLSPEPRLQREYVSATQADRMSDRGENFPALLRTILKDNEKSNSYLSWLKELTPAELDSIEILEAPGGEITFAFRRHGIDYPARILSDGTLRFAALAAAFFQPSPPRLLLLEEIEEGLHPTRLQLLVELLKSQTARGVEQVIATSHSPYAIAWLKEEDYKYVFLCTRNEETGATSITPFSEIPRLMELARTQSIADLFAEGWLETAV
jgi:energy-coupling factor transporter ATP-binding protein EcfA2